MDLQVVGAALSSLGNGMGPALIEKAKELGVELPAALDQPSETLSQARIVPFLRAVAGHFFPLLASATPE
jgi:hypothetical protein